jgi:hypothetical protein
VPKTKRLFRRTGLARLAFRRETRPGPTNALNVPGRDLSQLRSRTCHANLCPSASYARRGRRTPLSSYKANLVLSCDARTVRKVCCHGRRIQSADASVSLERQIMTLLSRNGILSGTDMNRAAIPPFVRRGTVRV